MRRPATITSLYCVASVFDKERIQPILNKLKSAALDTVVFYIDSSVDNPATQSEVAFFSKSEIVIFFASENSALAEEALLLMTQASGAHKIILTVYLEDCKIPEGLHLILDSYQAILWRPDISEDAFLSNVLSSIQELILHQKERRDKNAPQRTWFIVVILVLVILAVVIYLLIRIVFHFNSAISPVNLSPDDYLLFLT